MIVRLLSAVVGFALLWLSVRIWREILTTPGDPTLPPPTFLTCLLFVVMAFGPPVGAVTAFAMAVLYR